MAYKTSFLLSLTMLSLSACTLEPHHFSGTDLLAPDAPEKTVFENVKEEQRTASHNTAKAFAPTATTAPVAVTVDTAVEAKSETKVEAEVKAEVKEPVVIEPRVEKPVQKLAVVPLPPKPVEDTKAALCDAPVLSNAPRAFQKGEMVKVTVLNEKDLSGVYAIGSNGAIAFPLLGKVTAINLTPSQLQDVLAQKLGAGYLVKPDVRVENLPECNEK